MRRLLLGTLGRLAALAVGGGWLWVAVHVGAGDAAKVTCSLARNSGQDPERVFSAYVARALAPLAPWLRVAVDDGGAEASVLGVVRGRAVQRRGLGCTLVPLGSSLRLVPSALALPRRTRDPSQPWPEGAADPAAPAPPAVVAAIDRSVREPAPPEPGRVRQTTAVLVAQDGRLIAERYAPG